MADLSYLTPFEFALQGGLVLNRSAFQLEPGNALTLTNFEPDIRGGYRRITGFAKWHTQVVPFTSSPSEKILMSTYWGPTGEALSARGESVFRSTDSSNALNGALTDAATTIVVDLTDGFTATGTLLIDSEQVTYTGKTTTSFTGCTRSANGTANVSHLDNAVVYQQWTEIDSGRTNAEVINHARYNLAGTDYILMADKVNNASYWDGTTLTDVNTANAPADPKYVRYYKDHAFYAGMSANSQELVFSAPFTVDNFTAAAGAGSAILSSPITGLIPFRDSLYIFAEEHIYRLTGTSLENFEIVPVTEEIGCRQGNTIQEFAGDIVFLGPDGLRTIAGTAKIGDVELGTISRPVQNLFDDLPDSAEFVSLVIPEKTQYRLFLVNSLASTSAKTKGVICVKKSEGYEFAETKGIQPSCTSTTQYQSNSYILHGGFDGFVHRQEQGNDFSGAQITGIYRSVDISAGDPGIRKAFQRVLINYAPEGALSADMTLRYDYDSTSTARPDPYPLDSSVIVALYSLGTYGLSTYGGQSNPVVRQSVEGSGFAAAIKIEDTGTSAPYSLKGFSLEFSIAARR